MPSELTHRLRFGDHITQASKYYSQVPLNDKNVQSVLTFAVAEVGVEHIIVTGHTRCGGVAVCAVQDTAEKARTFSSVDERELQPSEPRETRRWPPASPIKEWLADLRKLAEATNWDVEKLSQENVRMQIDNVVNSEVVKGYWGSTGDDCNCKGRLRGVHGWMYDIDTGEVRDLEMSQYAPWIVPKVSFVIIVLTPVLTC